MQKITRLSNGERQSGELIVVSERLKLFWVFIQHISAIICLLSCSSRYFDNKPIPYHFTLEMVSDFCTVPHTYVPLQLSYHNENKVYISSTYSRRWFFILMLYIRLWYEFGHTFAALDDVCALLYGCLYFYYRLFCPLSQLVDGNSYMIVLRGRIWCYHRCCLAGNSPIRHYIVCVWVI